MNERPWQVIDTQTGKALQRQHETFGKANRRAEQLNQTFGAVRFGVRRVETVADHQRFAELFHQWLERDFDADNFQLHLELISMCERFGWPVPAELS